MKVYEDLENDQRELRFTMRNEESDAQAEIQELLNAAREQFEQQANVLPSVLQEASETVPNLIEAS